MKQFYIEEIQFLKDYIKNSYVSKNLSKITIDLLLVFLYFFTEWHESKTQLYNNFFMFGLILLYNSTNRYVTIHRYTAINIKY